MFYKVGKRIYGHAISNENCRFESGQGNVIIFKDVVVMRYFVSNKGEDSVI